MGRFKERKKSVPAIPTAALPDIIFILLFFFMVTTKMKDKTPIVNTRLPEATQLKKMDASTKKLVILIGVPKDQATYGTQPVVQVGQRIVQPKDIPFEVDKLLGKMDVSKQSPSNIVALIKGDQDLQYGIVSDVKQRLRESGVLRINYEAGKVAL